MQSIDKAGLDGLDELCEQILRCARIWDERPINASLFNDREKESEPSEYPLSDTYFQRPQQQNNSTTLRRFTEDTRIHTCPTCHRPFTPPNQQSMVNDLSPLNLGSRAAFQNPRGYIPSQPSRHPVTFNDARFLHPERNIRYKTRLCKHFLSNGSCIMGDSCLFAHGFNELRCVEQHPLFRTKICVKFFRDGACPFGSQCTFRHA